MSSKGRTRTRRLRWDASVDHQVTLNIDGSVKPSSNRAGIGGVMRNRDGVWMAGFFRGTTCKDPAWVEAEAMEEGLRWAWHRGVRDMEVQSDARNVIQWMGEGSPGHGPVREYMNRIKSWIDKDWRISFKVIYREQNKVADRLAGGGSMYREDFVTFADCPRLSEEEYFDDLAHVSCVRRVVESD